MEKIQYYTTPLYEFNLVKQKYECFCFLQHLMIAGNKTDEIKIGVYSLYLEFLSSLYEFYIAGGIRAGLISGKNHIKNEELIMLEVDKLVNRFFQTETLDVIPREFATQFRKIRNFKSHTSKMCISKCPSVTEFYRKYHKYIMILMQPPLFSWNFSTELWEDINLFAEEIISSNAEIKIEN